MKKPNVWEHVRLFLFFKFDNFLKVVKFYTLTHDYCCFSTLRGVQSFSRHFSTTYLLLIRLNQP
jgi:hypothetical protein